LGATELRELADSIRQLGVLQPITVRPKGKQFEIVCGERRFRACQIAELQTIPAIVRELTDDEAMEVAITENLCRQDVSPIEEATAYKRLVDTGRYDVPKLSVRFGKSEAYIRNRIKLNDLTDGILQLVNDDVLSISVALELCKYSAEVQTDIFNKHLSRHPSFMYLDWCNLTTKEFISRLESNYCANLSNYSFDKSQCAVCPLNTNANILFPEKDGKCTNLLCLREKNKQFLVDTCKRTMQENPEIEIVQTSYSRRNDDVYAELSEQGYTFPEYSFCSVPKTP
jgi:ParB family chromosome partitioning protein